MVAKIIAACTLVVATLASTKDIDHSHDLYAHTGSREESEHDVDVLDNMQVSKTAFVATKKAGHIKKIEYGMSEANTETLSEKEAEELNAKLALNHQKRLTAQAAHRLRLKHGYTTDSPGYVHPCHEAAVHEIKQEIDTLHHYEHPAGFRPQLQQRLDELQKDLADCSPEHNIDTPSPASSSPSPTTEQIAAPSPTPNPGHISPTTEHIVAPNPTPQHEVQLKDDLTEWINKLHAANAEIDKLKVQHQELEGVVHDEDDEIALLHADKKRERQQHIDEVQKLWDTQKAAMEAREAELDAKKAELKAQEEQFQNEMRAREAEFDAKTRELEKGHEETIQELKDQAAHESALLESGLKAEKASALLEMQCKHKGDLQAQLNYDTMEKHAIEKHRDAIDKMLEDMKTTVQMMEDRLVKKVTQLESTLPNVSSDACHTDENSSMEEVDDMEGIPEK